MTKKFRFFLFLLFCFGYSPGGYCQSINTEFGKNRVQYHDDFSEWWQYETQNFITYWYGKSRNVAIPTLQIAEQDYGDVQKLLEHRINDKIEIIVYLDISDLKQSNIGTEETFVNKTGETKIIGNKMFVYFDGNHQNLQKKIKEGIARVYFNHMLFGATFQEIIQNALLMNIPEWFKSGIISYATSSWNLFIEDELRDVWKTQPKMRDFKKFSAQHPRLAGHSFWYFIEQNYGKSAISNTLYLTKISRGVENSFLYVFNEDVKQVYSQWKRFYEQYFENEKGFFEKFDENQNLHLRKRKHVPVSQLQFNQDGKLLAYTENHKGKVRIKIKDLETGKEEKVFSYGFINEFQETDYAYPVFSWYPGENKIAICYEHRDKIRLRTIEPGKRDYEEQLIPDAIQRIYSISVINDNEFIFSASLNGFSDLIKYRYKTRNYEFLTNDFYDDLDATVCMIDGKEGVLFSSNRPGPQMEVLKYDTILPLGNLKTYFLHTGSGEDKTILLLHEEAKTNIRYPVLAEGDFLTYLSTSSGIMNLKGKSLKDNVVNYYTNTDRNIIRYHADSKSNQMVYTMYHDGQYKVVQKRFYIGSPVPINITPLQRKTGEFPFVYSKDSDNLKPEELFIPEELLFQSPFRESTPTRPLQISTEQKQITTELPVFVFKTETPSGPVIVFNPSRIIPANKKFSLHKVTTKFDNDILFEGLESYTGDRQQLLGTPMGFLMKANVKDLFEDYSIDIGTRLPLLLNGSEFFIVFDNKKSLIDKRLAIYRRSQATNGDADGQPVSIAPGRTNKTSTLGLYQWKIPFNIYNSIRITSQLRFDKFLRKSTENVSFNAPAVTEQRLGLRAEYIFDNTHEESLNIKFGTRYKVYVEAINRFNVKLIDGFEFDLSKGFTTIAGFDARHYVPLLYKSVLAIRGAGAMSFGTERMLYYVGGMENWIFPQFNNNIPQRTDIDFAYKANIGQMRGFQNNIRNGTTYLVTNTELRIPFMQYLLGKNKGSSFLRNLQLTGFFDVGMAWYGLSPYSKENPLNTVTIESPPIIRLEVEYFKDPAVFGTGFGLRTQVFGYFVKFDYGWGIETGKLQKPMYYITLGQDF